jgi:hypothetical protein
MDSRESLADVSISEAQGEESYSFHNTQGRTTCFRKYISKCENANVSFEFCLENAAGGQIRRLVYINNCITCCSSLLMFTCYLLLVADFLESESVRCLYKLAAKS